MSNPAKPVFTSFNVHSEHCGEPPDVRTDRDHYFGYFENTYGEQWVLVFNRSARRGQLRGGDCGWDQVFEFSVAESGTVTGLPLLNPPEQGWLRSCLRAALQ